MSQEPPEPGTQKAQPSESDARLRIEPVSRHAAGRGTGSPRADDAAPRRRAPLYLALAAGSAFAAAAVVMTLWRAPDSQQPAVVSVSETETASPVAIVEPTPLPAPVLAERAEQFPAATRDEAALLLGEFQALVARLEGHAALWAEAAWTAALTQGEQGEAALLAGDAARAAARFRAGIESLEAIDARSEQVFEDALAVGFSAIDGRDAVTALGRFELATAMRPEDERAATGLRRAKTLDEVAARVDSGLAEERAGQLKEARRHFASALEIDPEFREALQGISRVDRRLAEQAAQAAIARHRRDASAAEQREAWQEAGRLYGAALKIDASLGFARAGLERSQRRAALDERLEYLLADPMRLYDAAGMREAQDLIARAESLSEPGPRLRGQLSRLRDGTALATQPLPVRLESDGATEVTIVQVRRLGTFERLELSLRPGRYTLVGSRRGYRDVRERVSVVPGQPIPTVVVRCREAI
jgi:tetratricopeptide (TPR) repeat protein